MKLHNFNFDNLFPSFALSIKILHHTGTDLGRYQVKVLKELALQLAQIIFVEVEAELSFNWAVGLSDKSMLNST